MLQSFFPRGHRRFLALPLLGTIANAYAASLQEQGYRLDSIQTNLRALPHVDRCLRRRGFRVLHDVSRADLEACSKVLRRKGPYPGCHVRALTRFLEARDRLRPPEPEPPSRSDTLLADYALYLERVRGFAESTTKTYLRSASDFLKLISFEDRASRLAGTTSSDIERFVRRVAKRCRRRSLLQVASQLRSFLRYCAAKGLTQAGLDSQVDTPRVYRLEKLPRSLPWATVQALLGSIDRSTPLGLRDYAMLLLVATYGLRGCEVAALTLDDIDWRQGQVRVPEKKMGHQLLLPLTNEVGSALLRYLKRGRPNDFGFRGLFLKCTAPHGRINPHAVTEAFVRWSRRSGLEIPFRGVHCLRHSYAVHLLRCGTSVKTIGDLLGHRSPESTGVYLRLATEDLRSVALSLPGMHTGNAEGEMQA